MEPAGVGEKAYVVRAMLKRGGLRISNPFDLSPDSPM